MNEILRSYRLHQNQFASQPGKSAETAVHNVATHIQNAVEQSEIVLGASLGTVESRSIVPAMIVFPHVMFAIFGPELSSI